MERHIVDLMLRSVLLLLLGAATSERVILAYALSMLMGLWPTFWVNRYLEWKNDPNVLGRDFDD